MNATLLALTLAPGAFLNGDAPTIPPGYDSLLSAHGADCVAKKVGPGMAQTFMFQPSTVVESGSIPKKTLAFSSNWAKKVVKGLTDEIIDKAGWHGYRGKDPRFEMMMAKWKLNDATITWLDTIYGASITISHDQKAMLTVEDDFTNHVRNQLARYTNLPDWSATETAVVGAEMVGTPDSPMWLAKGILFGPVTDKEGRPTRANPPLWDNGILALSDGQTVWVRVNFWTASTWKSPKPDVAYAGQPFKSRFEP